MFWMGSRAGVGREQGGIQGRARDGEARGGMQGGRSRDWMRSPSYTEGVFACANEVSEITWPTLYKVVAYLLRIHLPPRPRCWRTGGSEGEA